MLPGTLAVISHVYPEGSEQARAIGIWAGVGSAALAAGPLLGGLLVQLVSWRAVFLLNVPIALVAVTLAGYVVRERSGDARGHLDVSGAALAAVLLGCVTFAFIEGGRAGLGVPTLAAIAGALVSAGAFLARERRAEEPMLPLSLFRRPSFVVANSVAGAMNLVSLGLLFVITLYLQDVRHHSPLEAGLALLPLFAPLSILAPLGGRITARTGAKPPMLAGLVLAAIGVALLGLVNTTSSYETLLPALLLWGIGIAILTPAVVAAAVAAVPAERAGLASAVNNTARQAAGAIGIAAFGALAAAPAGQSFITGLHAGAAVGTGLLLLAALGTVLLIR